MLINNSKNTFQLAPGLEISRVLTGLWQIADLERGGNTLDPEATAKAMRPYVEAGFTTFDMADHYGSAEVISGVFRKEDPLGKRSQMFTKWVPKPGRVSKEEIREAVELSLTRLQTERIDLLQYHAWNYADPIWLDTLWHLEDLKAEGLIQHIGVTNFDAAHLRVACASGIQLVSNQVCYSLLDQRASGEMQNVCEVYGVKLLAFGTLAGGFLSEKWLGRPEPEIDKLATWSQMKYKRFMDEACNWPQFQLLLKTLKKVASKHQVSIANVASKYMLDQPSVAGVILGARLGKSEHIKENLRLFEFELDTLDRKAIAGRLETFRPIPGDCGDEYRKPPFLTASGDLSHHLDKIPLPYPAVETENGRSKVLSGTVWEDMAGYCRAVRRDNRILVSGTTATHGDKMIGGNDPKAQAHFVMDKLEAAITSLGGKLEDIDRTRIYIHNMEDWEPVARAHGERFGHIKPANTMVQAGLIGEGYLVEMEAEAQC